MRVLVYGDATPASGGWCYAETLRDMGFEVSQVRETDGLEVYKRSFSRRLFRKLCGRIVELDRRRHVSLLLAEVEQFRPQIVIVQKGLHIAGDDVQAIQQSGAWVCNVNHDDFFSLNPNNWSWLQRNAIPKYDYIFTTREVNVGEVKPLNQNVEFFPFAYYPRIHRPLAIPRDECANWACDVVFVGTYERQRAAMMEELVRRIPVRLKIHGAQWNKLSRRSPLRACLGESDLRFDALAKALGGASIVLGFLRKENRDDYTQRTFEIPACNGLLLAERTLRHLRLYQEGVEAEFFDANSPNELCEKVSTLLSDGQRRERIRQAGKTAVLAGKHTYEARLTRLLQIHSMCANWKK